MPTYVWACDRHLWEVVCPVADYDNPQACPECQAPGVRQLTLPNIDRTAAGDWNRPSFNPALGQWTKSDKHARQIAKAKGLEEVGNEPVEKIFKREDEGRIERRAKRWVEADREKLYD